MAKQEHSSSLDYEVISEGEDTILKVDCEKVLYIPSLEDNGLLMAYTCDMLIENMNVTKLVFSQKMDYEYDYTQVQLLLDVAKMFNFFAKRKDIFSVHALSFGKENHKYLSRWYTETQKLIFSLLKSDPVGAYVELNRLIRHEHMNKEHAKNDDDKNLIDLYLNLLNHMKKYFEDIKLISELKSKLSGYKVGDRSIYRTVFRPIIKPDFMYTKLMADYPADGEEIDNYMVGDTEVTIFKFKDSVEYLYHITPPEFRLTEEQYDILDLARKIMSEHKPSKDEFTDPKRMRQVFINVGKDLIEELASYRQIRMNENEVKTLTEILIRYTVGFGLIEVLLQDEKIQDISVNSPLGQIPIFIVHADYDDCRTNIMPTRTESESWASKLRLMSGRPLDEANPILDTEIELPGASARVSVVSPPLNPSGIAYSFRRHRDRPWTLPLFIKYQTLTPLAAGFLSFVIDGTRSILLAGTRSSGKSSLLSSLLIEIMRRYRIITVEDTLELPTRSMRDLGYNIQSLAVASSLATNTGEMSAESGIRSTLRLGDSSLIVGEVRSTEAKALYEAMRVGAAANVVAGTIHGDSPYGIFDRVVNDIGVPKTSFKATDIIMVVKPIKSADGLSRKRRVIQITEVRKTWEDDPVLEGGFVDLFTYDAKTDRLEPTDELISGNSEILKLIASQVKEYAGNWDALWENIELRSRCKEAQVKLADEKNNPQLLEAEFTIKCNDLMHKAIEDLKDSDGHIDSEKVFKEWFDEVKREVTKDELKHNSE